jgi:hypothetical protein
MTPIRLAFVAAVALAGAPAGAVSPQPKQTAPALEYYLEGKWSDAQYPQAVMRVWSSQLYTRSEIEDDKTSLGLFVRRDAKDYYYNYTHARGVFFLVQTTPEVVRQARSLRPAGRSRWTRLGKDTVLGQPVTKWHVDGDWYYSSKKTRNTVCHFWLTDHGIELRLHCNEKSGAPASKFSFEATRLEIGKVNPRQFTFINDYRELGRVRQ